MHSDIRFWYAPNIGSIDMVAIFDDPATLTAFDAFALVTENILNLGTAIGPNTFEALQANEAFKKLKDAGVPLVIEGGTLSDLDVVAKIRDAGGEVTYFSYSEPLTYPQGLPYAGVLDKAVKFFQEAASKGVRCGILEAWPATAIPLQIQFMHDLIARCPDAPPAYWHADTDWDRSGNDTKTAEAIRQMRAACDAVGVVYGCFVNSTKDPIPTDVQHHANLIALAQKLHGIIPDLPQVHVAAWAQRVKGGPQDVPNNFGVHGLLRTFDEVRAIFGAPPQPPIEDNDMISTLTDPLKEVIAVKAIQPIPGSTAVTWILPNDNVYSCQPDGSYGERPPGTDGVYERNRTVGNIGTFKPADKYISKAYVLVDGL